MLSEIIKLIQSKKNSNDGMNRWLIVASSEDFRDISKHIEADGGIELVHAEEVEDILSLEMTSALFVKEPNLDFLLEVTSRVGRYPNLVQGVMATDYAVYLPMQMKSFLEGIYPKESCYRQVFKYYWSDWNY